MNGTLTRMKFADGHALRTDSVEGTFSRLPTEGHGFLMMGAPLEPGFDGRLVATSKVVEVVRENDSTVVFKTESGTHYRLVTE